MTFPEWIEEEKLQAFRLLAKKSNSGLTSYIARALKWEEERSKSLSERESPNEIAIMAANGKKTAIVLTSIDVRKMNNLDLQGKAPLFSGSPLIFLEFPKVDK